MKELITLNQANLLMLALLVVAPIIGLIAGAAYRKPVPGLAAGVLIGAGNLVLWKVYNLITERLGLDTVKNLLVNLALFAVVGLIAGLAWGWASRTKLRGSGGEGDPVLAGAGGAPPSRGPGESRMTEDAKRPSRDGG
ncbi:MAG: hypothetical protein P4L33_16240 [Capsulimonadaceae bacterium]|nr:hypothetical protein [Capsulimonadaceae bacterium]